VQNLHDNQTWLLSEIGTHNPKHPNIMKSESPEEFPPQSLQFDSGERKKFYLNRLRSFENLQLADIGYDLIIKVGNYIFKAHQMILEARCEYFRAMFSVGMFKEGVFPQQDGNVPIIELRDIQPEYFYSIHTYIYTDEVVVYKKKDIQQFEKENSSSQHIFNSVSVESLKLGPRRFIEPTASFYTNLMIYADFFCLQRLFEICENRLKLFINNDNLMPLMLLAYHHNCQNLLNSCLHIFNCSRQEVF
jgi:hypothetical protein